MTLQKPAYVVHTKILIHFLAQLIAILNSYSHTMSSMTTLKWSAGEDLQPCKTMTDALAPVERTNWALFFIIFISLIAPLTGMMSLRPSCIVRIICGQLVTSCLHLASFGLLPPHPPPLLLPTHPLVTLG